MTQHKPKITQNDLTQALKPDVIELLARAGNMLSDALVKEATAISELAIAKRRFEPAKAWVSITRKYTSESAPGVIPKYESLELGAGGTRCTGDIDMGAMDPQETIEEAHDQMFAVARASLNKQALAIGIKPGSKYNEQPESRKSGEGLH